MQPNETCEFTIDDLGMNGEGIAHKEGATVFIGIERGRRGFSRQGDAALQQVYALRRVYANALCVSRAARRQTRRARRGYEKERGIYGRDIARRAFGAVFRIPQVQPNH